MLWANPRVMEGLHGTWVGALRCSQSSEVLCVNTGKWFSSSSRCVLLLLFTSGFEKASDVEINKNPVLSDTGVKPGDGEREH